MNRKIYIRVITPDMQPLENSILQVRLKEGNWDHAYTPKLSSTKPQDVAHDIQNAVQILLDSHKIELSEYERKTADRTLYILALSTFGPEAQTLMMFEEMAELQKELCKHDRGKDNNEAIAEEIADVQIMLEQMIELHHCEDTVLRYRSEKMERLAERIKEAGEADSPEPVLE